MSKYSIGLDFGTESARAVLVDIESGITVASSVKTYQDGVIDEVLPGSNVRLAPDWALQNPIDWLTSLEYSVQEVMKTKDVLPEDVVGIGIDFTACTILPTYADGSALCEKESNRSKPHAWPKLWKHHAAQPQADRINTMAMDMGEKWMPYYGGRISSEWLLAKALQMLEEDRDLYLATDYIIEGADWVVWQLTGTMVRDSCTAGYKGNWIKSIGFPTKAFLTSLDPEFGDLYQTKYAGKILDPGMLAGGLSEAWAVRLGLRAGTPVAVPIIDAHAAAIGGGVSGPGTIFLTMGTSTCHMLMSEEEVLVEGISGVVDGGIVSGLYGYEAGQAGVGDIFAWFVDNNVPGNYYQAAEKKGVSIHDYLSEKAALYRPGQSGLLALDWWNGCRTPLVDADLGGVVFGYSLQTLPEEIYRALIEATAFGTRLIVELFHDAGISVNRLCGGGGLTKNRFLLKTYADCIGLPIEVASSQQPSAMGAAILGAVCSGYYDNVRKAVEAMAPTPDLVIEPDMQNKDVYDIIYKEYKKMVNLFGRDKGSILKTLRSLRS